MTIKALNEATLGLFSMGPDGKDIVYEPPPHLGFSILGPQELTL